MYKSMESNLDGFKVNYMSEFVKLTEVGSEFRKRSWNKMAELKVGIKNNGHIYPI